MGKMENIEQLKDNLKEMIDNVKTEKELRMLYVTISAIVKE